MANSLGGKGRRKERRKDHLGTIPDFTSHSRRMLWALSPRSQSSWGHGRQTLSAVEKLPQKSVTNKERKRKDLCLPLNEAKNGKRVWGRSGTQPAFSKWGRLNFPTSSQRKTTFKTTRHPPPLPRAPFHPLTQKTERVASQHH